VRSLVRKIAVYGTVEARVPVKQRFWKRRRDGVRQRYWKRTDRTKKTAMSARYEFHGKGKDLYKAVRKAHDFVSKGFVDVSAEEFLKNPERYGYEGLWIEREIES
jgi:hypothetical protein